MAEYGRMTNTFDSDPQIQEPNCLDSDIILAEQHEQEMRNLCSDETRSII